MESMTDTLAGRVDQMIKAYRGREIGIGHGYPGLRGRTHCKE